jgi:hypothetical protein
MLHEDLMLLFIDQQTGKVRSGFAPAENALAGAVLMDLVNSGRVAFEPNGKKLQVVDPTPVNDPVLHESLSRFDRPMRPQRAVERVRKKLQDKIIARLADRGVVRVEPRKVLGIFPAKRYVITDERAHGEVRKAVGDVAAGYRGPDERTGALITMLYAVDAVHRVFDGDKRELKKRAKEIAAGHWAGDAVRRAVDAVQSGVQAAASAAVTGE